MKPSKPYLSVVIPAYNEAENFQHGVLDQVSAYLDRQAYAWEVIIVDDGSEDKTAALIESYLKGRPGWKLVKNAHQGKAQAVKRGVAEAQGKLVLFTDFDQATPIGEVEKLLPFLDKGYAVAIGSREVKGSRREAEPFYRHLMGRGWNFFVQALAIRGINDTQCGFKLFDGRQAKRLFAKMHVYRSGREKQAFTGAFDVEVLFIAQKWGLRIAEVPVNWTHVRTNRVSPVRDSLRMFLDLIKIRQADCLGKYNA